ncbi:hypothetical protein [Moorena producens]|uniref:hypothetical protein n=1 Tax=Moorena producens TaxID=1155739 RepID=UPI000AD8B747|nr:hypothetical protein [Moorena producens]
MAKVYRVFHNYQVHKIFYLLALSCSLLPAPCSLLPAPCSLLPKTQEFVPYPIQNYCMRCTLLK